MSPQQEERPASPEIDHSTRQSAAPLARLGLEVVKGYKRDEEAKDAVAQSGICQTKATYPGNAIRLKLRNEIRIPLHAAHAVSFDLAARHVRLWTVLETRWRSMEEMSSGM